MTFDQEKQNIRAGGDGLNKKNRDRRRAQQHQQACGWWMLDLGGAKKKIGIGSCDDMQASEACKGYVRLCDVYLIKNTVRKWYDIT